MIDLATEMTDLDASVVDLATDSATATTTSPSAAIFGPPRIIAIRGK